MAKIFTDTGVAEAPNTDAYKRWAICDVCEGEGKHSHSLGCITSSEMDEWSDEEQSRYFAGKYDRRCSDCDGKGKVKVYAEGAPFWVRRIWAKERRYEQVSFELAQEYANERRMFGGGY